MNRWLWRFLGGSLFLAVAGFAFLTATDPGLRCLVQLVNHLSGGVFTIGSASGSLLGPLHLRDLRYADSVDTVVLDQISLTWDPRTLFQRELHIHAIHGANVRVLLGASEGESALPPFSLPGRLVVDQITVENVAIFINQEEIWHLRNGTLANLSYQGESLRFDDLTLTQAESSIRAQGAMRTSEGYPVQWTLDFLAHPAGYEPLAVRAKAQGPINALTVAAELSQPFPASLQGRLDNLLGSTTWEAHLESPEILLPRIQQQWPEQRFSGVSIAGRGTLSDYALKLHATTNSPRISKTIDLSAELQGDFSGMRINEFHLAHDASTLAASGRIAWSPVFSWQAEVSGSRIDPSLVLDQWPGQLTGSLTTTGHASPEGTEASLVLSSLHGTLRTFPVAANGEVHLHDATLQVPQLTAKSGGSSLRISGTASDALDLSFQLDSSNLAELWPGIQGRVKGQGHLSGRPEAPQIDLTLAGNDVGFDRNSAGKLTLKAKGDLAPHGLLDATLRVERLRIGTTVADLSQLHLQGSLREHTLKFESQGNDLTAGFVLMGAWQDDLWRGSIERLHLTSRLAGAWHQRQSTLLTASKKHVEVKPLCLEGDINAGSLCLNGSWQAADSSWHLQGTVATLSFALLQKIAAFPWPLTGQLNADLELTGRRERILSGELQASSTDMSLALPLTDNTVQRLAWKHNTVRVTYANNQLHALLDSALADNSLVRLDAQLSPSQLTPADLLEAPLSGSLQLNWLNLSPLAGLTDNMVTLSGSLHGQFTFKGTPAAPRLKGQMELVQGRAELPALGITLAPLTVQVTGDTNAVQLLAKAHSGNGSLIAESVLQFDRHQSAPYTIRLSGDRFKAVNLPGLDLDVSPDLHIRAGERQTEVEGTVTIPYARITSIDFSNTLAPSDDMVIIDADTAPVPVSLPLSATLTVVTEDQVQVDAYGLRGFIDGKLAINIQPNRLPVGNGTLAVRNGTFTIYGRRLNIDLGRLFFTGGPLTNPGIELRSEKKGDKFTVGVIIDGFLQHPEMRFYSTPFMEQGAIMAHLLESTAVGGETRQDTGFIGVVASKAGLGGLVPYLQNVKKFTMIDEIKLDTGDDYDAFSLVFGSWLTPDFYVSYGKDLVNETGTFTTRYSLGKGFYFLTETGSSQSGGDIKYEFEH